jgi:6-phosphogluconolactonase (cycloisomerase 2 family)
MITNRYLLLGALLVSAAVGCNGGGGGGKKSGSTTGASTATTTSTVAPATSATVAPTVSVATLPPIVIGTPTAPAKSAPSRFLYVGNDGDSSVQQFSIDPIKGTLTAVGTPVSTSAGGGAFSLVADAQGKFLHALLFDGISTFAINPNTGALTPVAGSNPVVGSNPWFITIDPTGSVVIVADASDNTIRTYKVGATGALTVAATANAGPAASPRSVCVSPDSKFVYSANNGSNDIAVFALETGTGQITKLGSNVMAGVGPRQAVLSPAGDFLYCCNVTGNTVSMFSRDKTTGALTALATPTVGVSTGSPYSIALDPAGKFAYVASDVSNDLTSFKIESNGSLTKLTPSAKGSDWPIHLVVDHSGSFAFTADYGIGADSTTPFAIDPNTGIAAANGPASKITTKTGYADPHAVCVVK